MGLLDGLFPGVRIGETKVVVSRQTQTNEDASVSTEVEIKNVGQGSQPAIQRMAETTPPKLRTEDIW